MTDQSAPFPAVSVIVPVYNADDMIGECIEALLAQDYPKDRYEIIIVDNDSTDGTAAVIKRYPVKYVLEDEIHTSYAARNAGARHAKGEALAFCDADQIAGRAWLRSVGHHWKDCRYAAFTGPTPVFAVNDSVAARVFSDAEFGAPVGAELHCVPHAGTCNLIVRASLFWEVGGFDGSVPTGEDYAFCRRLREATGIDILFVPRAIQWHRSRASLAAYLRPNYRGGVQMELRRRGVVDLEYASLCESLRRAVWRTLLAVPVSCSQFARRRDEALSLRFARPYMIAMLRWAGVVGRLSARILGTRALPRGW